MKSLFDWWTDVKRNAPSSVEARAAREKFCKALPSRGVLRSSHGVEIALKNIKYFTFFSLPDGISPPDTIYIEVTTGVAGVDTGTDVVTETQTLETTWGVLLQRMELFNKIVDGIAQVFGARWLGSLTV